jgi:anti-sigma regulatory factor (Ser/Thr protein kinase)
VDPASPAPEAALEIELAPPRLHGLRALAEKWALHAGFSPSEATRMLAGVDEALANIHVHSYSGRPGWVRIEVEHGPRELAFRFFDRGRAFDPDHAPARKPGELGTGGWGSLIIQGGFPRVERKRVGDKNILLLARPLPREKGKT